MCSCSSSPDGKPQDKYARRAFEHLTEEWISVLELYVKAWLAKQKASNWFRGLFRDEEGATIAEYAILLAVVVVALIAILGELTDALRGKLSQIINGIRQAPTH